MEKTVEQLQKELSASQKAAADNYELANLAQKQCDDYEKLIAELTGKLSKTEDEYQAQVAARVTETQELNALRDEVAQLKTENALLEQYNKEYREKLASLPKPAGGKETFELDDVTYEVLSATYIQGMGKLSAIEIASHEKAQRFLVEKKSGVIREIK